MMGRSSPSGKSVEIGVRTRSLRFTIVAAVCVLIIGVYAWAAHSGWLEVYSVNADNTYYNLLVRGFRSGQLNLEREVPAGFAQLANPFDPKAMSPYLIVKHPLHDLSYYQGKLHLYFGVTPALVLFWPYAALTGHYLLHKDAVVIFLSLGLLASVSLLWALWRRYFADVSVGAVAAGALALGLVNLALVMLPRCEVYETAISCGYALTMVTLLLLWQAMHATRRQSGWLAGASLAYGLAVGARPSLLGGALILLLPVAMAWRKSAAPGPRPPLWPLVLAATAPITLIGLGLMIYNLLRFDQPLEFGSSYQLTLDRASALQQFSPRFLWFNLRVGFLAPAHWSGHFPFVRDIAVPPLLKGGVAEQLPFGILTNIPLVWLAVAAPLAWRSRLAAARSTLRGFLGAVALLFGTCALTLCLHNSMTLRYQLEFTAPLVLLAVVGVLGLERAAAGRSFWRRVTRWGWGLLLVLSVAFNLFAGTFRYVETQNGIGMFLLKGGWSDAAIARFRKALAIQPGFAAALNNLGEALVQQGRVPEAIEQYEHALRLTPDFAEAHINLAWSLLRQGQVPEAVRHYEQALQIKPDLAPAHYNLGTALVQQGRLPEAVGHLEQAVRLQPGYAEAHNNLAWALFQLGRVPEAIAHYEEALRLQPDSTAAHFNFGKALLRLGRVAEAIRHCERAVQLKPSDILARNLLAWMLATCADASLRNGARAVELAGGSNQATGGSDPAVLDTLAAAYAEVGRFGDAVRAAQTAVELAKAAGQVEQTRAMQERLQSYQAGRPYHEQSTPE